MNIPFTSAEFYGVFSAYNTAVWPMQLPLMALGVLAVLLTRPFPHLGCRAPPPCSPLDYSRF